MTVVGEFRDLHVIWKRALQAFVWWSAQLLGDYSVVLLLVRYRILVLRNLAWWPQFGILLLP